MLTSRGQKVARVVGVVRRVSRWASAAPWLLVAASLPDRPAQPSTAARVLLVEDDAALGELFAQILRERGHAVELVSSVASAIPLLEGRAFDVVVTDLRLPGASGLELLTWIRRRGDTIRVVVASAFTTSDLVLHARRLGAECVLSKPVEPHDLVEAIEAA